MRLKSLMAAASLLLASTCSGVSAAGEPDIMALVVKFAHAYRDGDTGTVDQLLTSEYSHINNGGKPINREAYLDWIRKRKAKLISGDWSVDSYEISDLKVTMFRESAIVTGVVTAAGVRDGEPWNSKVRFTNLWIKEEQLWKRAAFHDTKINE